jgi:hypothetical protein
MSGKLCGGVDFHLRIKAAEEAQQAPILQNKRISRPYKQTGLPVEIKHF